MAIIIGTRTKATQTIGHTSSGQDIQSYNNIAELDDIFQQTTFFSEWENWKTTNDITNTPDNAIPILSQATSNVDSHKFTGEKMDANQTTAFPRMNLLCNGEAVTESTPDDVYISHAYYVISHIVNPTNYSVRTGGTTTQRAIREVQAGSTSVTFDNTGGTVQVAARSVRFDELDPHQEADRLLRCYEVAPATGRRGGSRAFGTSDQTFFSDPDPFRKW